MDQANAEARANEINSMLDGFMVAVPVCIDNEWMVVIKTLQELSPNTFHS